jgi:hypothetical protein
MGNIHVKNGTPVGSESLCHSCSHALVVKGYSEMEELVFCTYPYDQLIKLPFKVYKCTGHKDKNMPTWKQMEDMAINLNTSVTLKPAGFYYADEDESVAVPVEQKTMNE